MARSSSNGKLVEYLGRAFAKEREIESALAAQLVMTTRPGYKRRLEQHLEATKLRAAELERRIGKLGGEKPSARSSASGGTREVKRAAKTVTDRAVTLAKGPVEAMGKDHEASRLLENARGQFAEAGEQVANYRIVRSLAKAAGDKPTGQLAKAFRRQHEELGDYVAKQLPKLSKAVAKTEAAERKSHARSSTRRSAGKRAASTRARSSSSRSRSSSAASRGSSSRSRSAASRASSSRSRSRSSGSAGKASQRSSGTSGGRSKASGRGRAGGGGGRSGRSRARAGRSS